MKSLIYNKPIYVLLFSFLLSCSYTIAQVRVVNNKGTISTIPIDWTRVLGTTKDIYNTELGNVGIGIIKPMATFHNAGSTILGANPASAVFSSNTALTYTDIATYTVFNYSASASGLALTLPTAMTDATPGRMVTIANTGATNSFSVSGVLLPAGYAQAFVWNGIAWSAQSSPVALSVPFSGLTAAIADNTLDNTNFAQTWNWTTADTQNPLKLKASALTTGTLLSLSAPALTSGYGLSISGGAASMSGNLLNVTGASNFYGAGGIRFNFTGDHDGTGFFLSDLTTIGNAMKIWGANVTTGNAFTITGGSALTTGSLINATAAVSATTTRGLLNIANTAASSAGTVVTIQANSTAGSGLTVLANGNVGVGTSAPAAALHLQAGTATAGTAPLKLSSGVNLTTAESGAVEFDGTHFYGTAGTNRLTLDNSALSGTAGGTADAQTVTNSLSALTTGMTVTWVPSATNATTTPTLAVGTSAATTVKKSYNGALADLAAGDIVSGVTATAAYDGTNWILQNSQTGGTPLSSLTAAVKDNTIDNKNFAQIWNWSTATTEKPLKLNAPTLTDGTLLSLDAPALTGGNILLINGGAESMIGSLLSVNGGSTSYDNGGVQFKFNGDHSGIGLYLADYTTAGEAMRVSAWDVTTGYALNIVGGTDLTSGSLINASAEVGATTTKGLLNIANTAASSTGKVATIQANSTAGSGLTVLANGNVGIGNAAPTVTLDVTGDVKVSGVLSTPSDMRLKKDIETLTNVLSKIEQMRGVRYEYKDQQKYVAGPQVGVIAQELQKVFPELVRTGADGFLSVNYSQLTAVLIQAVKEQQQEIDLLKKQMKQVMEKLNIN
jgi:hypothetical protein